MIWPAAVLVLLAAFFLWWLRLGESVEHTEGEPLAGRADSTDGGGKTDTDEVGNDEPLVEQIPAAEPPDLSRAEPVSPDGSTSNGYDDYFRRR
jgi:hypothetical protein